MENSNEFVKGHGDWKKCGCEICYYTWLTNAFVELGKAGIRVTPKTN